MKSSVASGHRVQHHNEVSFLTHKISSDPLPAPAKEVIVLSDSEDSDWAYQPESRAPKPDSLIKSDQSMHLHSGSKRVEGTRQFAAQKYEYSSDDDSDIISESSIYYNKDSSFRSESYLKGRAIYERYGSVQASRLENERVKHENSIRLAKQKFCAQNRKRCLREGRRMCFKFNFTSPFNELRLIRLMDDWHSSLASETTDIDVIREIEDSDFKDGESAIKAAQDLVEQGGSQNGSCAFYIICRYQMTDEGVERDEGFTTGSVLMKIAPDKMINYCEGIMQDLLNERGGLIEMNKGVNLL